MKFWHASGTPRSNLTNSSPIDLITLSTYPPATSDFLHTLHSHKEDDSSSSEAVGETADRYPVHELGHRNEENSVPNSVGSEHLWHVQVKYFVSCRCCCRFAVPHIGSEYMIEMWSPFRMWTAARIWTLVFMSKCLLALLIQLCSTREAFL